MNINSAVNNIVWGPPILVLIVGVGLYLSVKTGFFSITKLGYTLKNTLLKMFSKEQKVRVKLLHSRLLLPHLPLL